MAINYAAKYSEKIDERFALMSVTAPAVMMTLTLSG